MTADIATQPAPNNNHGYAFAAKPRPAGKKKASMPGDGVDEHTVNIMHDRRVHRGNTYAGQIMPYNAQPDPVEVHRQNDAKRRAAARKRLEHQQRTKTPEPVEGRQHMDIQTELFLEELTDRIPEADAFTQTDDFLDRAPTPFYVPQKSGVDAVTQVEEGELFDFDFEVEPILEVVVGKTLEQAVMEVMEEEEWRILKKRQEDHEHRRNVELAETQRMEQAERRRAEEVARRLEEQNRLHIEKKVASEKMAAHAFTQSYLEHLFPVVFDSLTEHGYFYDPVEKEITDQFLPWLTSEVDDSVKRQQQAEKVLDEMLLKLIMENSTY